MESMFMAFNYVIEEEETKNQRAFAKDLKALHYFQSFEIKCTGKTSRF